MLTSFSYSIPELKKTKGAFVATTSRLAVIRLRTASDYSISKLAVNRLIEFAALGKLSNSTLT